MDTTDANGPTDAALVAAWTAGEERGYEQIVARYAPMVYHRCRRALGAVDADDATQAVFLILARRRDQAAASPVLAAWLMMVAGNVVRNALRDRKRRSRAEHALPPSQPATDGNAMDDIQESFREHLDASLASLPAAERDAVIQHHLAGRSLAEVAQATGSGLSTVKDRLKRGLERLRSALAARGISLSLAVLASCLAAEAQAAVPSEVLAHLRDLTPAGGGPGAATGPSPRALRWSQQRSSLMTRIALAGTALLIIGGAAALAIHAAEPGGKPAADPMPAPIPQPAPVIAPLDGDGDLDPERARQWILARWNDGPRLVQRLRTLPEAALLPPEGQTALEQVAGLRSAAMVLDGDVLMPSTERIKAYRLQRDLRKLSPAELAARNEAMLRESLAAARAAKADPDSRVSVNVDLVKMGTLNPGVPSLPPEVKVSSARPEHVPTEAGPIPATILAGLHGRLSFAADDAPLLQMLRGALVQEKLNATQEGATLRLDGTADPAVPGMLARAGKPLSPEADIEIDALFDPGLPGRALVRQGQVTMTVTPDGLRLSARGPWGTEGQRAQARGASRLDLARFAAVPAEAILAGGIALRRGEIEQSAFWKSMKLGVLLPLQWEVEEDPQAAGNLALIRALSTALDQVDGTIVAWVEPAAPIPAVTLEVDLPRPAYDEVATAVATASGVRPGADGSVMIAAGPAVFEMGWRGGRLVLTSKPGGIAALGHAGGFTGQPEIVKAIAAMPDRSPSACVLMRPAALAAYAGPYVAMTAPAWSQRVTEYERRLEDQQAYGFLSVAGDEAGMRVEAAGMLSLVAGAVIGGQIANPAMGTRIAN